jgi:hypothetical protein
MTDAQARTTQALSGLPEAVEEAAARGARQAMSREPAR